MSNIKNPRMMVAEIRGALDAYPREQLQEILAWVFKEYVVEGGAAPAQGALAMLDARTELEGLSFAELVTWLQLHLDVPELTALEVQGDRVSLRTGGRSIPIEVARAPEPPPATAAPASPPMAAAPSLPSAAPQPLSPAPRSSVPAQPSEGRRVAPNSSPPMGPAAEGRTAPNAATPAGPAPAPANQPASEEKKDDPASSRFSWLEVD